MPLFGRKNEPTVTLAYENGPKVPLVQTPGGTRPLKEIVDWGWVSIAATAWDGFKQYGRGAVYFDADTGELNYLIAEQMYGEPELRELVAACEDYIPDIQVVLFTTIVHARGFRKRPEPFTVTLTTPKGGMPPVAALALAEHTDELAQFNAALRAKMGHR